MIEKDKIRKYDFITSLVLILLSCLILIGAFGMPRKGSYGGVQNMWYVSPALMPMIIGFGLLLLSLILLANSITTGGAKQFMDDMKHRESGIPIKTQRVIVLVLMLFNFIYMMIPRVDFFLSISFFLLTVVGTFYIEQLQLMKKITVIQIVWTLFLLLLAVTGLDKVLSGFFSYTLDIIGILVYGYTLRACFTLTRDDETERKHLKTVIWVALLTPSILCPLFRYVLLVPLPVEGLIFDRIFNSIYYLLR